MHHFLQGKARRKHSPETRPKRAESTARKPAQSAPKAQPGNAPQARRKRSPETRPKRLENATLRISLQLAPRRKSSFRGRVISQSQVVEFKPWTQRLEP